MNITWWIIGIYVVGIFVVGLPIGKKSIKIWGRDSNYETSGGFWGYILFPISARNKWIGTRVDTPAFIADVNFSHKISKQIYVGLTGVFWPFRIVFIIIPQIGYCFCAVICFPIKLLGKLTQV
jgi:hypothetical protein